MLVNLFFFTITITKRKYTTEEISKIDRMNKIDAHLDEVKSKSYQHFPFM